MSRRLTPYFFAGILGVVSGVYIFKPLVEENAAIRELRGAAGAVKSPDRLQSSNDTAPEESK